MILVLCPLPFELDIFRKGALDKARFHVVLGGHGKVQFALETYRLGRELKPELIVCAGSAGGLAPGVNAPDVVVAEATVEHDFNLKFMKAEKPRFPGHGPSLERLRKQGGNGLHFGLIASGDEDVVDEARAAELFSATGALAVAWEGAGGARAAAQLNIPFIEIRGITDSPGAGAIAEFKKNLKPALENVAGLLRSL